MNTKKKLNITLVSLALLILLAFILSTTFKQTNTSSAEAKLFKELSDKVGQSLEEQLKCYERNKNNEEKCEGISYESEEANNKFEELRSLYFLCLNEKKSEKLCVNLIKNTFNDWMNSYKRSKK